MKATIWSKAKKKHGKAVVIGISAVRIDFNDGTCRVFAELENMFYDLSNMKQYTRHQVLELIRQCDEITHI